MKRNMEMVGNMIFPGLLGVYTFIMVLTSPVTLTQGIVFFLFQIFGMLVPGMALLKLLNFKELDDVEHVTWGYAIGYALNIVEYFILAMCNGPKWLKVILIMVGIVSVVYMGVPMWVKNGMLQGKIQDTIRRPQVKKDLKTKIYSWLPIMILLTLVLGIRYFTYYGLNLFPTITQNVTFPTQDLLFYIGNAISAEKGFPVQEFRFSGEIFKYHYFGSIQLAVAALTTGIDVMTLEFCLAWMQGTILVVTSFWCFLKRMKISNAKSVLGMVMLLFTTGWELLVYVAFQHKMYQSPFGWDIGMAFGIITLTFMYMQYQDCKLHFGIWLALLLVFFLCEGSKAPIAVIVLLTLGCVCALWLLKKGMRFRAFIYGLPLVLVFVSVFFGIVSEGMGTITTNGSGLRIDFTGHLYECGLGKLYFQWTSQGMPGGLGKILIFMLFFLGCNMAVYYLFSILTVNYVRKSFKNIFSFETCLIVGVCIGLLFTLITKQSGNSQMYFAMAAFPMATAVSMKLFHDGHAPAGKWKNRVFVSGFVLLLLLSFFSFIYIIRPSVRDGFRKLSGVSDFAQENNSLTFQEQEGYHWVRENTENDAVCITNVIMEDEQYQSFIVGVCTERQMYVEGWRYVIGVMDENKVFQRRDEVHSLLNGDILAKEKAVANGVDYVIWTKRYGVPDEKYENFFGEKLFDNGSVTVYKLSEN